MRLTAHSRNNLQLEINARDIHHWIADEPVADGGDEAGPNPYDLLLGSLAACTIITLQMYAKRKGWPLEKAEVGLDYRKIDAAACEDCTSPPGSKVDLIEMSLTLHGPLDDDQRARLYEIAKRCPVHRTLLSETKIRLVHHD
ncbi:MAG: OsmC family protein [Anaerolineae bacterium]|nr:OsmC family protein [Anaerolineae bacterium]